MTTPGQTNRSGVQHIWILGEMMEQEASKKTTVISKYSKTNLRKFPLIKDDAI